MTNNAFRPYRTTATRKEIDLRSELADLLHGSSSEIPKGRTGLLRTMRRDDDGELLRCPCRDSATDEPEGRDYYCRYCLKMGFFWDETEIVYYKNEDSFRKGAGTLFYIEYDETITDDDYIVEVALDNEGVPIVPVERTKLFEIERATQFRADNARVEFWEVQAIYRRKWSVWYGVQNRQYA